MDYLYTSSYMSVKTSNMSVKTSNMSIVQIYYNGLVTLAHWTYVISLTICLSRTKGMEWIFK